MNAIHGEETLSKSTIPKYLTAIVNLTVTLSVPRPNNMSCYILVVFSLATLNCWNNM